MNEIKWTNKLLMVESEKKLWKKISQGSFFLITLLIITLSFISYHYFSKANTQRLLLVAPSLGVGPIEVESDASITDHIAKTVSKKIVDLNENWTYESLEENFKELFQYYYDKNLTELTQSNLLSSDRLNYVKKNKMISVFNIDWERSKVAWCSHLKRSCSLIVGSRKIFINNNDLHKEKEVAYLIFSQAIFPTLENPHAIRVKRLKVDDYSQEPYRNLLKQYESAMRGVLPNDE